MVASTVQRGPRRLRPLAFLEPAVLAGSLVPFAVLASRAARGTLGANPIATALNQLGLLALVFLVASLACTPAKIVLGITWPLRVRKLLGMLGFYTVLAHFLLYAVVDQGLALGTVLQDVGKRPFIAVGFGAFVLLVPVALTSGKRAPARLGFTRWKRIHSLVYVVALLAVVHFYMRVKADVREPLLWGALVAVLLGARVVDALRGKRKKRR